LWQVGEKYMQKELLGGGYNLAIAKEAREKKDTRALEHPWAESL
jgi:hypothetical protein